jgi:hypothetical protein
MAGVISAAVAREEGYRTDINPALRYYQAFNTAQNAPRESHDELFTNEWRGRPLTAKFGELVSWYDNEFKLLRKAAHTEAPCDWGLDLTEGPELLLPHLAQAKGAANAARLRVMWDLQNGRQTEARDDLLATLALARNITRDGTLISVLVQIAMENILISTIAENFHQFTPETLKQLEDGFAAAPARGTTAQAVKTGESSLYDWLLRKVQEAQKRHPGDEAAAMAEIRATFQSAIGGGDDGKPSDTVEKVLKAAGSSDGLLKLIAALPPMYDRAAAILSLPRKEYETQIGPFTAEFQSSENPVIGEFFPALTKAHPKEFAALGKLAMLRAAVEYKLHGEAGFNGVSDPTGDGPFVMQRFVFQGVDRGFEIKSSYAGVGYPEVMIFVEKEGVPFLTWGKRAGEAEGKAGGK